MNFQKHSCQGWFPLEERLQETVSPGYCCNPCFLFHYSLPHFSSYFCFYIATFKRSPSSHLDSTVTSHLWYSFQLDLLFCCIALATRFFSKAPVLNLSWSITICTQHVLLTSTSGCHDNYSQYNLTSLAFHSVAFTSRF